MGKRLLSVLAITLWLNTSVDASTVYRYQDEQGRWHFTDREPRGAHETVVVAQAEVKLVTPQLQFRQHNDQQLLFALNPLHAPVEFELLHASSKLTSAVVEARSESPVVIAGAPPNWQRDLEYRVRLGRPISSGDGLPLRPPVPTGGKFLITQAFGGTHSHSQEPNRYAIDVAMPVGETITAARDGIVVAVKDDYHMGGATRYFLDKANRIEVLHSDGTFGVYGHILLGSAVVIEGQRVRAGDPLAGAGSSGFSTGPHLHFGLRANNGERMISLPFKFKQGDRVLEPQAAQWLQIPQTP